jgi:hypothetical protein
MHVVAFAPSTKAVAQDAGGVRLDGFPMTSAHIDTFPKQITIPLVLAVYTQGGTDYDPRLYVVARSPEGERVGALECAWHWPDNPGAPVKFRVFAHHLPLVVNRAGVYRIGLFDGPDATETDHAFPLPVIQANPLLPPPQPSTRM